MEFIHIRNLHIDESDIKYIVLDQVTCAYGTILLELQPDFRMLPVKAIQKFRKKDGAQHRRNPEPYDGFGSTGSLIIRLQVFTVRQNGGHFVVKYFSLFRQRKMASRMVKKCQGKFFFQITNCDGDRRLCDEKGFGCLRNAVIAGGGAEIAQLI